MKSRMDSISATVYGEVETLEVKESMRVQHTTAEVKEETGYQYRCSVELRATHSARSAETYASWGQ